jgi:diguanylate cyclase (GGDEF)-like protein
MKKKNRAPARKPARSREKSANKSRKGGAVREAAASKGLTPDRSTATIRRLRKELATAQQLVETLQASVDTDHLLGILNRRGFERELNRSLAYIKRYQASGALIVLDVDRLKPINDSFGHAAGDRVLKAITAAITRQVRASDVVGRLGGDEFAVVLWNLSKTDARAKAATLEEAIDRLSFVFDGRTVTAGASAGVTILDTHSEAERALEEADSAMYVRKAQRRHERDAGAVRNAER